MFRLFVCLFLPAAFLAGLDQRTRNLATLVAPLENLQRRSSVARDSLAEDQRRQYLVKTPLVKFHFSPNSTFSQIQICRSFQTSFEFCLSPEFQGIIWNVKFNCPAFSRLQLPGGGGGGTLSGAFWKRPAGVQCCQIVYSQQKQCMLIMNLIKCSNMMFIMLYVLSFRRYAMFNNFNFNLLY